MVAAGLLGALDCTVEEIVGVMAHQGCIVYPKAKYNHQPEVPPSGILTATLFQEGSVVLSMSLSLHNVYVKCYKTSRLRPKPSYSSSSN